jgi:hypothetical protein
MRHRFDVSPDGDLTDSQIPLQFVRSIIGSIKVFPTIEIMMLDEWKNALNKDAAGGWR